MELFSGFAWANGFDLIIRAVVYVGVSSSVPITGGSTPWAQAKSMLVSWVSSCLQRVGFRECGRSKKSWLLLLAPLLETSTSPDENGNELHLHNKKPTQCKEKTRQVAVNRKPATEAAIVGKRWHRGPSSRRTARLQRVATISGVAPSSYSRTAVA